MLSPSDLWNQLIGWWKLSCMLLSCSPYCINILSLFLFCQFNYYVSQCVPPWVYPTWKSLCFLDVVDYFLFQDREIVFSYYLFKYFLVSFLTLKMRMLVHLVLSQRSLRLSSFLFILSSIFCSVTVISNFLSSRSFICASASVILLWIPSSVLVIYVCLFFIYYRSLVKISCIFLIFVSIIFPRFWVIFTVIILNYFSGRLPMSTSFSCFSGVLSYPLIWDITFCFFQAD